MLALCIIMMVRIAHSQSRETMWYYNLDVEEADWSGSYTVIRSGDCPYSVPSICWDVGGDTAQWTKSTGSLLDDYHSIRLTFKLNGRGLTSSKGCVVDYSTDNGITFNDILRTTDYAYYYNPSGEAFNFGNLSPLTYVSIRLSGSNGNLNCYFREFRITGIPLTSSPTRSPSHNPSSSPTDQPSVPPTPVPTLSPSVSTIPPTLAPSVPTLSPSVPTIPPTTSPTATTYWTAWINARSYVGGAGYSGTTTRTFGPHSGVYVSGFSVSIFSCTFHTQYSGPAGSDGSGDPITWCDAKGQNYAASTGQCFKGIQFRFSKKFDYPIIQYIRFQQTDGTMKGYSSYSWSYHKGVYANGPNDCITAVQVRGGRSSYNGAYYPEQMRVLFHRSWLTPAPSPSPTVPTTLPSPFPTHAPTALTAIPTQYPTQQTTNPTTSPSSRNPTRNPTVSPVVATTNPSDNPTNIPSDAPTPKPTFALTFNPTNNPSVTYTPTTLPTSVPTFNPTNDPSVTPTALPTSVPTFSPTPKPTGAPLTPGAPTRQPTVLTSNPSTTPTKQPSDNPIKSATLDPTAPPSAKPTLDPTQRPTDPPYAQGTPTNAPQTSLPTDSTTIAPTATTTRPTDASTSLPTDDTTIEPTTSNTRITAVPSRSTTIKPSSSATRTATIADALASTRNPHDKDNKEVSNLGTLEFIPTIIPGVSNVIGGLIVLIVGLIIMICLCVCLCKCKNRNKGKGQIINESDVLSETELTQAKNKLKPVFGKGEDTFLTKGKQETMESVIVADDSDESDESHVPPPPEPRAKCVECGKYSTGTISDADNSFYCKTCYQNI